MAAYVGGPGFVHLAEHKGFIAAFSLGNLWIALGLNLIGLRIGKWVQNLGAYGTWLPAALFVALALWSLVARGSATTFSAPALVPTHLDLPLLSLFATMTFAFAGLELAPTLGDEIHDPVATLRRGIVLSGIGIVATYVLGTAAMLVALPAETVSVTNGMPQATATLVERLSVPWLAPAAALVAALLTLGNLGGVGAWIAGTARIPFVAGVDEVLPRTFGKVHPRWQTPYVALLVRRRFAALNAPLLGGGGAPLSPGAPLAGSAAVSGVLRVPALLFKYKNTPYSQLRSASQYDQVLFSITPPSGRPYTYRTFYEQMSHGLFSVQGKTFGYAALDSAEVAYAGYPPCFEDPSGGTNCNGLFSSDAYDRMQNALRQTLRKLDGQIDWTLYDSDGDGYVDLVVFIHPTIGGECGGAANNHLWSHRSALSSDYITHSVNSQGKRVRVADYILEGGVGGADLCDSTQIMPISAVAHETGHGFGLPDLYDVYYVNAGVGVYSLMSWGVYTSPLSPARMDAWSLNELGWVTVVPLPTAGTYSVGPVPTSDTAFFVPVAAPNPDGEYFLLENRQAVRSDSAMINYLCQVSYASATPPASCGGGLLVWHVDSAQIANGLPSNTVNSGPVHGLALVQADGLDNLAVNLNSCFGPTLGCYDYGDAADPYPGEAGNFAFTATSVPPAVRNSDGKPAGLALDQITRLAPNGAMSFRVVYPVWVVRAQADTATVIQFDAIAYHVFRGVLAQGSTHTVGVADTQ